MERRKFLTSTLTFGGLGLASGLYAWQIEPFWLEFVHRKLPIDHLPPHLQGKTLMQISDMHVGNRFDPSFLGRSLKKAQAYQPDFVVYTGDYVSYEGPTQIKQLRRVLDQVVLGKLGTFGILGNHDYGHHWSERAVGDQVAEVLADAGITVLRNAKSAVEGLTIIGFDDYWSPNFRPELALSDHQAEGAHLLLCHNPDVCDRDVWQGYKGWILAGHTHGGQCKPPFLPPPVLPVKNRKYTSGEFDLGDGRRLYINRALGHTYQVRFNVRPEITVFELTSA